MRKLKFHEKKLMKKVNLEEWKESGTSYEHYITSKFLLKSNKEFREYGHIVGLIRKLTNNLSVLPDNHKQKLFIGKRLILLLYDAGIIKEKKLLDCSKVKISDLCYRRIPMMLVQKKIIPNFQTADRLVQQGHIKLGIRVINDTNTLVSRGMENFLGWVDDSKIRMVVDKYNDNYDDYKYI